MEKENVEIGNLVTGAENLIPNGCNKKSFKKFAIVFIYYH